MSRKSRTPHTPHTTIPRRRFLKYQAAGVLWLAAGAPLAIPLVIPGQAGQALAAELESAAYPDLAIVKGGPAAATRAAVELLGGMGRFVQPRQKVVIKPNISFPTPPERASTTHPEVVQALVRMCQEAGAAQILVVDNPLSSVERCLENSGIREACELLGPDIAQGLTASRFYEDAEIPGAKDMPSNQVLRQALEADVLISCPVAKSHSSTGVSLSLKGMMGLIANRSVMHWRHDLDQAIVDLNHLLKADLTVIDATRVLSTGGPGGPGEVIQADTVIASADPVAADAATVFEFPWYGRRFQPRQVAHIRLAGEQGLGRTDIENLRIERVNM